MPSGELLLWRNGQCVESYKYLVNFEIIVSCVGRNLVDSDFRINVLPHLESMLTGLLGSFINEQHSTKDVQ